MLAYFPAIMIFVDSPRYARINSWPLFGDFWMPAGYPMLLQLLHAISNRLWVTIAFQHLLGVSIGAFLFLALRRLGIARWIACLPAAVPLLSGDQLYQEHTVMSDFFFTVLATAGVCVAIRGLVPTSSTQMACGRKRSYRSGRFNAQYWLRLGTGVGRMQRGLVQAVTSPYLFGVRGRYVASSVGSRLLLGCLLADTWALSGIE